MFIADIRARRLISHRYHSVSNLPSRHKGSFCRTCDTNKNYHSWHAFRVLIYRWNSTTESSTLIPYWLEYDQVKSTLLKLKMTNKNFRHVMNKYNKQHMQTAKTFLKIYRTETRGLSQLDMKHCWRRSPKLLFDTMSIMWCVDLTWCTLSDSYKTKSHRFIFISALLSDIHYIVTWRKIAPGSTELMWWSSILCRGLLISHRFPYVMHYSGILNPYPLFQL